MLLTMVPQVAGQLDFGLATAGTRLLARYGSSQQPAFARRVFLESLLGLLIVGAVVSAGLTLISELLIEFLHLSNSLGSAEQALASVEVTALWSFIGMLGVGATLVLRAHQQYRALAFVQAGGGLAFWLGATALAYADFGVTIILFWGAFIGLVTAAYLLWHSRAWLVGGGVMPSVWLLPSVWRYGAGAFTAQVSSLLTYHLDNLLVGALVSPAAAGVYTACANLAAKLLAVIAAISTFSFPQATVLHAAGNVAGIQRMFVQGSRVNLSLAMILGAPAIALSEPFVRFWLGPAAAIEFAFGFSLLVLGYVFAACSVVAANVVSGMGDTRTPALFSVIGGCLTLLLCLVLVPELGSIGAALASMIGMSQALAFVGIIGKRLDDGTLFTLAKLVWPTVLASLIVGALLNWLAFLAVGWWSLVTFAGSGAAIIACVAMRGLGKDFVLSGEAKSN